MSASAPLSRPVDLAACRRPDKRAFATQEAVAAHLRRRPMLRGNLPYRCPAGHWHYGRPKPKGRQPRKARSW